MGQLELYKNSEQVNSRQDLADFVRKLGEHYVASNNNWENTTVDTYLEALSAVIDGIESGYRNAGKQIPEHPDWSFIAKILLAATVYE